MTHAERHVRFWQEGRTCTVPSRKMAAAAVTWEAVPGGGGGAGAGGGTPSSEYKHREGDEAHARLWRAGGARRDGVKRHAAPPRVGNLRPRGSRPCRCGRGAGSSLPPWRGRG